MKPLPPPAIQGKTQWERFDNLLKNVLKVPKIAITEENQKTKQNKDKKSKLKKQSPPK
jgi:hypothetical protein